ncbi:MAG: family 20 glycosylhydrolase, partial [Ferruginibacter sp.]
KDEHALQSYFIQRIEKYLHSKGRNIIGWDEILEGGLAPNATVMSWRGEEGGIEAAQQNHDVIMTPGSHCYLDHSQSKNEDSLTIGGYLPLEKVYSYEPVPPVLTKEQAKHILGAQGNVWTEYMNYPSKVEYMIFPRMQALSEVLWTPSIKKSWTDFERRLPGLMQKLKKAGINYSAAYYDLKATILPAEKAGELVYKLESKDKQLTIQYTKDGNLATGKAYQSPIQIEQSNTITAATFKDGLQISNALTQEFKFNLATGKKISLVNEAHKSYPGDGAFTLVNGVQNEKKLARSAEFLGFLGRDLDALIDLNTITDIQSVKLHVLDQNGSWIYLPSQIEITYLPDTDLTDAIIEQAPKEIKQIDPIKEKGISLITINSQQKCRYLHIVARNYGNIPSGNPGAGNPAWLFVDEIEVN